MALTFTQYPDGIAFVGSRLGNFTVCTSSYATASDFIYQVQVWDSGSEKLGEFALNPQPPKYNYRCAFNTADILYPRLSYNCNPTSSYWEAVGNKCLFEYNVVISGSIQSGSGYVNIDSADINHVTIIIAPTTVKHYVINAALDYDDSRFSWFAHGIRLGSFENYMLGSDLSYFPTSSFLTQYSSSRTVQLSDWGTMGLLNGNFNIINGFLKTQVSSSAYYLCIETNTNTGSYYYITNPHATSSVHNEMIMQVPVGPMNLNNVESGRLNMAYNGYCPPGYGSVFGSLITSAVKYYDVYTMQPNHDAIGTPVPQRTSLKYRFYVDDKCTKGFPLKEIMWMNTLGQFDWFTFTLASTKSVKIDRKRYNKYLYPLSSNYYSYGIPAGGVGSFTGERGRSTYNITSQTEYKVSSNWINEAEYERVAELFTSPVVYEIDTAGNLYPIEIIDSDFVFKTDKTDKLFNLTVNYQPSWTFTTQKM